MKMRRLVSSGLVLLAIAGCSSEPDAQRVQGIVTVLGSTVGHGNGPALKGEQCWVGQEETDIVPGLEVRLRDGSGALISLARLGEPTFTQDHMYDSIKEVAECGLPFSFSDVAVEDGIYTVELDGRGSRNMSSSELDGLVTLAIN